jgi:AcrR family transcriptional regulator
LTRERILEAAEAAFARTGLNGTRVREIADAAGVNVATLYLYFPSKSHLHEAVLERGVRPLIDLMTEFSAGSRGTEAGAELFTAVMKHLGARPNLSRLIYIEAISEGRYLSELARRWLRPLLDRALSEAKNRTVSGPWDESLTPLIVAAFVHLSFGHFALAPLFREVFDTNPISDEWVAQQTKFMATLIRQMFPDPEPRAGKKGKR